MFASVICTSRLRCPKLHRSSRNFLPVANCISASTKVCFLQNSNSNRSRSISHCTPTQSNTVQNDLRSRSRSTSTTFAFKRSFSKMSTKKYDMVVYGASGFTGQYCVDQVAIAAEEENLTWAVAGRNMAKLQKVLGESSRRTGKNLEETPIIIADSSSPTSLEEMAKQSKVVLNCVGPYRFYGEPVVKACIEHGAHHLDISGELQYIEKMQLMYNGKAKENKVFVIGATGFDSVPAEAGLLHLEKVYGDGKLTNIENFVAFKSGPKGAVVNTGTFESAVHAIANYGEIKDIRKLLYPEPMPKNEYKLPKRTLHYNETLQKWCIPFIGVDDDIVHRTIRDRLAEGKIEKPFQFVSYMLMPNLIAALGTLAFVTIFATMAYFAPTRWLMLKFPRILTLGVFKKGGPTQEQIDGNSFNMTFLATGFDSAESDGAKGKPNRKVVAKLTGLDPGYVSCSICMTQCAVTILKEMDKMHHKGGIMTAGAAFYGTSLVERLNNHSVKTTTVSDSAQKQM